MSFIIPKDDTTQSDRKRFREAAMAAGIERCAKKLGQNADELTALQALNMTDFGCPIEQWNTAPLLVLGTQYSVFQNQPNPTLGNNRLVVFYGISIETIPAPVSRLTIRLGTLTGNVIAEYDLEQIINSDTVEGYFNQPVCIDPTAMFAVQVTARIATGVIARIQLMNWLIIPAGQRTA